MARAFVSFLDKIGADFQKGVKVALPFVEIGAQIASTYDPALAPIISTSMAVVIQTEQKFAAMGQQAGTGSQKLAEATAILSPVVLSLLQATGSTTATSANVSIFITALVDALNAFPAPTITVPVIPAAPVEPVIAPVV